MATRWGAWESLRTVGATDPAFNHMTSRLQELAGGRLMVVLEGGYNVEATALAAEATVRSLLGERLPLACSETKYTSEELIANIYLSELHIKDIDLSLEHWSKYWPKLRSDPSLLQFEKDCRLLSHDRRFIVGPRCDRPDGFRTAYPATKETFAKFVPPQELALNQDFFRNNAQFAPALVSLEGVDGGLAKLTMRNLLTDATSVIANVVLHPVCFDAALEAREEVFRQQGTTFFQLKYGVKEIVTHDPLCYRYRLFT